MRSLRLPGDPRTSDQWQGARVRLTRDVSNHVATIAEGTIVTVLRKHGGYEIETDKCAGCGVRVHVTRVERRAFTIVTLPREFKR